jgi:hypothetical protein
MSEAAESQVAAKIREDWAEDFALFVERVLAMARAG